MVSSSRKVGPALSAHVNRETAGSWIPTRDRPFVNICTVNSGKLVEIPHDEMEGAMEGSSREPPDGRLQSGEHLVPGRFPLVVEHPG
jgi:hypothetical protein